MDLSIIIVNWNSQDMLRNCIDSIRNNERNLGFEIFVVDNASRDDSLQNLDINVRIIRNKRNLGFSKACNKAIKASKGRYVLLLNPDTLILKSSFKKMTNFLDENKDVGVLGCKLLNLDGSVQPSCHAFLSLTHVFFEVSQLDCLFPKKKFFIKTLGFLSKCSKLFVNYSIPKKPVEVDSVMGSCYIIRRSSLEKIGLLDENFFLYHEEMELSYRMWQKGYKVMFYPYAFVMHYNKYLTKKIPNFAYYERCKSILHFFKKHKSDQKNILKFVMFFSLLINSFSLPLRKDFKKAFKYRLKVLKLLK